MSTRHPKIDLRRMDSSTYAEAVAMIFDFHADARTAIRPPGGFLGKARSPEARARRRVRGLLWAAARCK